MYHMEKDHFKAVYDEERDTRYVELAKDEETKNHKECDSDIESLYARDERIQILSCYNIPHLHNVSQS